MVSTERMLLALVIIELIAILLYWIKDIKGHRATMVCLTVAFDTLGILDTKLTEAREICDAQSKEIEELKAMVPSEMKTS